MTFLNSIFYCKSLKKKFDTYTDISQKIKTYFKQFKLYNYKQ